MLIDRSIDAVKKLVDICKKCSVLKSGSLAEDELRKEISAWITTADFDEDVNHEDKNSAIDQIVTSVIEFADIIMSEPNPKQENNALWI